MSRPSVTVIVPVYNVSAYIEKCARSLFEQSLDNLEILFVDDCSPDDSSEIIERLLREYPNRNSLTRIIKMPTNAGQSGVRRHGIIEAQGDYIIHCDGDDWVDLDYYESLYDKALQTGADIVVGDEVMEYPGTTVPMSGNRLSSSGKEVMKNWYRCTVGMHCHNKLVRRSIYTSNDILPWVGLNMWEDNGLFARLFYHADKVVECHGPVYHYNRCNLGAMTSGYGLKQVEQMIAIASNLDDFFKARPDGKDYEKTVSAFKFLAKLNLITDSFENYRRYKKLFPESNTIVPELDLNAFSGKGRFRFRMVKYGMAPLFILMFKLKNAIKL